MRALLVLPALFLSACCCGIVDSFPSRVVGAIDIENAMQYAYTVIRVPEDVRAGVPFQVEVVTFGSSSCTTADGAEVEMSAGLAQVTPYDLLSRDAACTADMHPFPRSATLTFPAAGDAVVRVIGRGFGGGEAAYDVAVAVQP